MHEKGKNTNYPPKPGNITIHTREAGTTQDNSNSSTRTMDIMEHEKEEEKEDKVEMKEEKDGFHREQEEEEEVLSIHQAVPTDN